jgi:hypothetical protein
MVSVFFFVPIAGLAQPALEESMTNPYLGFFGIR